MENNTEPMHLFTLQEAAELLQVSTRTLHRMIQHGNVPALKVGGQWRVRESSLSKWMQELVEER
jgi:excisionase family DNA binding protein